MKVLELFAGAGGGILSHQSSGSRNLEGSKAHPGVSLTDQVRYGNSNTPRDRTDSESGGPLNPEWAEWYMGWPIGWTGSDPLATDRFHKWLQQHGAC